MMSLDDLKKKLNHYVTQRNQTQRAYEQLCGAIHVIEEQIRELNAKLQEQAPKAKPQPEATHEVLEEQSPEEQAEG